MRRNGFTNAHAEELRWRYLYGEGEVTGIGSTWRTEYVPIHSSPAIDMRCIAAARRMRSIDVALSRLSFMHQRSLRLVYDARTLVVHATHGQASQAAYQPLSHKFVFGPAGALVPLVAMPWHVRSRSKRPYASWLHREMSKASRGTASPQLVRELSAAADRLLEEAQEAYARQRI